jgi:hypothetical protein
VDADERTGASDVWASAIGETPHLPAVRASTELAVPEPSQTATAARTVLGLADALVTLVGEALDRPDGRLRVVGDVTLGAAWQGYRASARVVSGVAGATAPLARLVADPPLVPSALRLGSLASGAAATWRRERPEALHRAQSARDAVVPPVVDAALAPVDLTDLVVRRVDLETVVLRALDQLDLTRIVLDRVRLEQVVSRALAETDLTAVVVDQVDLERVVNSALDEVDLNAVIRDRVDLVGIAQEVIDAIDLPEIIRDSTGSVASETVRSIRMQSIDADQGVSRVVDRVIAWRRGRDTTSPAQSQQPEADDEAAARAERHQEPDA